MKVLGIINHNNRGGAQAAMQKLMRGCVRYSDAEVQVVYLYQSKNSDDIVDGGIVLTQLQGLSKYIVSAVQLLKYLVQNKPDAVICFLPLANLLGSMAALIAGIKIRIISHRNPIDSYNPTLRRLDRVAGTLGLYSEIICNSESVKESLANYPTGYLVKCKVVYNCVDSEEFEQPLLNNEVKNQFERVRLEFKKVALAVGRLSAQKNYDLMFEVISLHPEIALVIAGHGELHDVLKSKVRKLNLDKQIYFFGSIDSGTITYLMQQADIFIQTSLYEGQSNSLLEALASKNLIFASDIASHREVLSTSPSESCGMLFPLDDISAWDNALNDFKYNLIDANTYKNLIELRLKSFTLQRQVKGFLETIKGSQ